MLEKSLSKSSEPTEKISKPELAGRKGFVVYFVGLARHHSLKAVPLRPIS